MPGRVPQLCLPAGPTGQCPCAGWCRGAGGLGASQGYPWQLKGTEEGISLGSHCLASLGVGCCPAPALQLVPSQCPWQTKCSRSCAQGQDSSSPCPCHRSSSAQTCLSRACVQSCPFLQPRPPLPLLPKGGELVQAEPSRGKQPTPGTPSEEDSSLLPLLPAAGLCWTLESLSRKGQAWAHLLPVPTRARGVRQSWHCLC